MNGFCLDENGDVVIKKDIVMVSGEALVAQNVKSVLKTNKKEWFLNNEEGIDFKSILVKNPDFERIRDEVQSGLKQIDKSFLITEYESELKGRVLAIKFKARNQKGETLEEVVKIANR